MLDFAAVFNALPAAAVVVDASSSIVAVNAAARELLGSAVDVGIALSAVPRLSRSDVVVVALGDGHRLLQPPSSSLSPSSTLTATASKEEIWHSYVELRAKYRQLLAHLDQAPVMLAIVRGKDHVFEIVNPLYEQYARRPLLGLAVAEAFPEVVAQGVIGRLDEVYRTGVPMVLRSRAVLDHVDKDAAAPRVLDVIYQPLKEDDVVTGIFILATDVTLRHESQERAARLEEQAVLLEAERRFLIESIPQQAWIAAAGDGALDFVNDRAVSYFGAPLASLLGHRWHGFAHADDLPEAIARWQHSLATGDDLDVNFRMRRHDGAWRWHVARASAMRGDDGNIVKWFGTSTDIDDQVRAHEELASRVEFEEQLIGIVSHDLRNPLNAISLSAVVADGENLEDKQRAALKRVNAATSRATRLINDLLDFSQARSSGTIPVNRESVCVAEIVDDVVDERRAVHVDCRIEVVHDNDDVTIGADHDRLAQLFDNLIGNAVQHSPKGRLVTVTSRGTADVVIVEIENEGTIAAADLPRVFLPFQRGHGQAAPGAGHSVGLGLFIASKIAEAHGGTITATSTTTTLFTVTLPRARA